MKRALIGGFVMMGGLFIVSTILLTGAIYVPDSTSWWSGRSKFWFAIIGGEQYGNDAVDSLFLGFPLIIGVILSILGLVILGREYYQN
ncbi:hypothetical protein QTL97_01380 [Sporosarcina thermotolerans]|uniref:Phosphatase n=1 Tax=Sporosarcina thermotolerans TaxID=633404 RepID=A0AAW9A783_9BACL|nr:hypothetical protein [Sporosarcina thermotolerans]MDW0115588.1 hypothetical protein [Sporosarcina thermotolerans]WHT47113.1 hypothetical protein QNH10_12565 [Sporosarcina thermotolerans]